MKGPDVSFGILQVMNNRKIVKKIPTLHNLFLLQKQEHQNLNSKCQAQS
jgi:hypothetical protein